MADRSLHRWFGGPDRQGKPLSDARSVSIVMRKRCRRLVRAEGLEPPQLSSLEPKSSASTSSATPADSIIGPAAMPRAAAYNMQPQLRSKKMARPGHIGPMRRNWTFHLKNGPDRAHGKSIFPSEP